MNGCGYTQTVINEVEEKKKDLIEFGKLKRIIYDKLKQIYGGDLERYKRI